MTPQERAQDIKAVLVAVFAFMTALLGWLGIAVLLLVLAMLVDYLTGSMAAKAAGEWSSDVARAGLRHKLGVIIAVGVAAFADAGVQVALHTAEGLPFMVDFEWPQCFTLLVTLWYFFTELGSILENCGKLGAPIPKWLRKGIAVLQNKTEAKVEEDLPDGQVPENQTPTVEGVPADEPEEQRGKHEKGVTEDTMKFIMGDGQKEETQVKPE